MCSLPRPRLWQNYRRLQIISVRLAFIILFKEINYFVDSDIICYDNVTSNESLAHSHPLQRLWPTCLGSSFCPYDVKKYTKKIYIAFSWTLILWIANRLQNYMIDQEFSPTIHILLNVDQFKNMIYDIFARTILLQYSDCLYNQTVHVHRRVISTACNDQHVTGSM